MIRFQFVFEDEKNTFDDQKNQGHLIVCVKSVLQFLFCYYYVFYHFSFLIFYILCNSVLYTLL